MDNLKRVFSSSKSTQINYGYKKSKLDEQIVDLLNNIKRINSFNGNILNLSNAYSKKKFLGLKN